jgi:hypothetical protein
MDSAARTRSHAWRVAVVVARTVAATSELHDKTLSHELGSI